MIAYDIASKVADKEAKKKEKEEILVQKKKATAQKRVIAAKTSKLLRGWGRTSSGGASSERLEVGVDSISNDKCAKLMTGSTVNEAMLCASGKLGEDLCKGDSGGPLTVQLNGPVKVVGKAGLNSRISIARDFFEPFITTSPTASPITTKPTVAPVTQSKVPKVAPITFFQGPHCRPYDCLAVQVQWLLYMLLTYAEPLLPPCVLQVYM
ncbi:hypothetical protein H257_13199 [Aphanomyces astaci]|uniref:Peptidase S1 domain-containing protein n=1 Tax=Aphanomyces astaci TaxID=112090 RepID=W4FX50_APHAT|nr:hypothetical protein H257_13199 [Aphanomyces astaci]ETV71536.1 hypothetical protein H257_13199 [Aphanomyces astaci]|eukprot:XP_009838969.1 hypothetical protein H257_13199 [Aphanomyces astaci]